MFKAVPTATAAPVAVAPPPKRYVLPAPAVSEAAV